MVRKWLLPNKATTPLASGGQEDYGYNDNDDQDEQAYRTDSSEQFRREDEEHVSPLVRLRRRNIAVASSSGRSSKEFAMRSTHKGSNDWTRVIRPFVSDLVFRSVRSERYQSEVSFRPYTTHAAVLFVDLSSYSKITNALAHRGAHFLSSVVNAYLSRILKIVRDHGGDAIKFAGDAIVIVWESPNESDLGKHVICAAKCALELQEKAGSHPVYMDPMSEEHEGRAPPAYMFRIHCGLACGLLESEIFAAPMHTNMQRLYHSVSGEVLVVLGELVELSKSGEIAIDNDCMDYLGSRGTYRDIPGVEDAKILLRLELEQSLLDIIDRHIEDCLADRLLSRNSKVEEEFIHPSVLRLLAHGGQSPTQIAQMRNLCVLFIAKICNGDSVNWLLEVQGVLDKNRCPIVQIIDDDKGVHVIAAVNLYEAIPGTSLYGLNICHELQDQQVGCAIGMALGSTFTGVTGSSKVACRWDITGPPAVRAARLMQYALAKGIHAAIDASVYTDGMGSSSLKLYDGEARIKGTEEPISVYTLSEGRVFAAFKVLETVLARSHPKKVAEVTDLMCDTNVNGHRCAIVIKGPCHSGKKGVCQQAAGRAGLVPFLHVCDDPGGLLQLAQTMAMWYECVDNDKINSLARTVLQHLEKRRWSRAHDTCIDLVNKAIDEGIRACFLVDRFQFLDSVSLSLMRECLYGVSQHNRRRSSRMSGLSSNGFGSGCVVTDDSDSEAESSTPADNAKGTICFLCAHVLLYNWRSAEGMVEDLTRGHRDLRVPIIEVGESTNTELRTMFRDHGDMEVEDRWLVANAEPSGLCAGYFMERVVAVRNLSGKLWKEGKPGYAATTEELVLHIPPGYIRRNKALKVMEINPDVAMRFASIYDELPPLLQTCCKVLAIGSNRGFYRVPKTVLWQVLNDLIAQGVEDEALTFVLDEMLDLYLIKSDVEGEEQVISFQCPALGDIALDVCTPVQVRSIVKALIERLEPLIDTSFRVPFVLANLSLQLGRPESCLKGLWQRGYKAFLRESSSWPNDDINIWKELIDDEIEGAGYDTLDMLGEDFTFPSVARRSIGSKLPLLKIYSAPVAFGPMGNSLSVITRNTFHECRNFHGASQESACELLDATRSAMDRYLKQMDIVEDFLKENGVVVEAKEIEQEKEMIRLLSSPALSCDEVLKKAETFLESFIPTFVEKRLNRLYDLVERLREKGVPAFISQGDPALHKAYALVSSCQYCNDTAQRAIMKLATLNWKPRPTPEYLPVLHHHTVPRIRDKVLKRLSDSEAVVFIHRQSIRDFEAFLIITSLLYQAQDNGAY